MRHGTYKVTYFQHFNIILIIRAKLVLKENIMLSIERDVNVFFTLNMHLELVCINKKAKRLTALRLKLTENKTFPRRGSSEYYTQKCTAG